VANLEWVEKVAAAPVRSRASNPLNSSYQCADGLWLILVNLQSDRAWPGLCRALRVPEMAEDTRFDTASKRATNRGDLISWLDQEFAQWPRTVIGARLDAEHQLWAPMCEPQDLMRNEALDGIAWNEVEINGVSRRVPTFPMQLSASNSEPPGRVPELGEHTEEVLLGCGVSWEEISELRRLGAFG
jgi:crotonobetainyl-CoA:carnitine CoA-transferase CaiB-like acyl-CoA transferase